MLEITKEKNEHGYIFTILTDDGKFDISFAGNLDLYWGNVYDGNILEEPNSKQFMITKGNYYLYSLFEELYENIKNCNVFTLDETSIFFCETVEELENKRREIKDLNDDLKKSEKYNPNRLFRDGVIEWHCEDFPYEESSVVKIKKEKEKFIVIFEKSKNTDIYLTYHVRFRNSGSRYEPFNIVFMKMYHKLINYDPEYHQIHIEEYLYQKRMNHKK
jgi:hypothetical protein